MCPLAAASVYHWVGPATEGASGSAKGPPRQLCGLIVLVFIAVYPFLLSEYSILNHRNSRVPSYDLAIYDNLVWNMSHGYFLASQLIRGGTQMSAHFDPIFLLISSFYLIALN